MRNLILLNNNFKFLSIVICIGFLLFSYFFDFKNNNNPTPAEYIQKKKDRKVYKQYRKDYFKKMHKAEDDINWRVINQSYRNTRSSQITQLRNNLDLNIINNYEESFFNRDLEGIWQERGSNNLAGRVHTVDVDFDSGMIYCASSGGNIWKGSLDGVGWVCVNDYMQINNINMVRYIHREENDNRLLISAGNKFYYSDNEGFTINQSLGLNEVESWGEIYRSVVTYSEDSDPIIFVLTKEWDGGSVIKIFRSDNLAESFYEIYSTSLSSERAYDIWTDRYENSDIFFLKNGSLYLLSTDNNTLHLIGDAGPSNQGENILSGGKDESNNGEFHFHAKIGSRSYFSNDGGITWQDKGELPSYTFSRNSFNCSYDDMNFISVGGIDLYKSLNAGNNWEKVNDWWEYYGDPSIYLHADIPEIQFLKNNNGTEIIYISTDGGLYDSNNRLMSVDNLSLNGLGVSQYYSTYTKKINPYQIFAGSQDQGFQRSIDYTNDIYDFEQVISGDYGHLVSGDDGISIWTVYPGFAMYYPNASLNTSGITWDFEMNGALWLPPLMEDPNDPSSVYLAGGGLPEGHHIIKLTRNGNSIESSQGLYSFNSTVTAIAYSPIDPLHRYVLTYNGKFYYSDDGGLNWSMSSGFTGPESHYFYGSKILPSKVELGKVVIAGSGYSNPPIFISYNHGNSFQDMSNGMPSTLVYDLASTENENYIFAATAVGAFAYSDEEEIWIDMIGLSGTDQTYWSVEYIPEIHSARFGTYGRGIWDFVLSGNYYINLGDVNEDNNVNIQDIIIIINFILGNLNPSQYEFSASDINEDGVINVLDIVQLVNMIMAT